jgi:heterodisulfide reductase subunit A-like polyferredoxin
MSWRLALCTCNGTLPWDGETIRRALGLADDPAAFARLPRDEIHRFMDWLSTGSGARVLVACCGATELLGEAARAAGVDPVMLSVVDARASCFRPHPDPAAANAKAARVLRTAMRLADVATPAPRIPVHAGARVLIVTDSMAGIDLARRLADVARPQLVLDERSAAFDAVTIHPLPFKVNWGRLGRVDGTLGAFRVTVEHGQPLDLRACIHCLRCVPRRGCAFSPIDVTGAATA